MSRLDGLVDRGVTWVTRHNRIVLLVMLVASALVVPGITQLETGGSGGLDLETQTTIGEKAEYVETNYGGGEESERVTVSVYVRGERDRVLTRETFLAALRYQRAVRDTQALRDHLANRGVVGPPNLVARRLSEEPNPTLEQQIAVLKRASEAEVTAAVRAVFRGGERNRALLPRSYEPQTGTAESFRMQFAVTPVQAEGDGPARSPVPTDVAETLHSEAAKRGDEAVTFFTTGKAAREPWLQQRQSDLIELIVVPALALVVLVLAITYRDVADVIVGFVGVLLSVLWMFGVLGWLGVPAGLSIVIGPVLIIALSIDFGLHVFMRYREERRPEEGIRAPMDRSTSRVAVAFLLVTVTAAIGFLANLASPLSMVRQLGIAITLGVVSAFVLFVTLVPALKVSVDGLLERLGLDRRATPLGEGRLLKPVLGAGATLARSGAPVVVAVALVAGALGGLAYTDLDQQGVQRSTGVAEWKTELPGPLAWESADAPYQRNTEFVRSQYQSDDGGSLTRFLIEGDATDPATLERVAALTAAAGESEVVFTQGGRVAVRSPLSVMRQVAREDESFARTLAQADTDGDGVPDRNVARVYDALYEAAPDRVAGVIERTEGGEYRSLLVAVPVQRSTGYGERGAAMHDLADRAESDTELTVTPVGSATLTNAELGVLADGILRTMLIALATIAAVLAVVFRLQRGSALLGAITVVPIALVVGLVFGGMYVLEMPLTFVTALLMSITVGLGVDYSIHVTDRFADELDAGRGPEAAMRRTVTGTGGALLGSMLTSGIAFATMLLHPSPQLRSFGGLVVLALGLSFIMSVYVLPSLLHLWATRTDAVSTASTPPPASGDD